MKKWMTIVPIAVFLMTLLVSCGSGGLDGTYIAKNEAAKSNYFAKFVFSERSESGTFSVNGSPFKIFGKGKTVKIYMGMMGVPMPMAYEYRYTLKGNKLIIEGGIPGVDGGGVEFTYDKENDEILLNMDFAFDMLGGLASQFGNSTGKKVDGKEISNALKSELNKEVTPVWGKEGTFDPNDPFLKKDNEIPTTKPNDDKVNEKKDICKVILPPQEKSAPKTVEARTKYLLQWNPVSCATEYIVHWSFRVDGIIKEYDNTGWIDKLEWTYNVPDECGYLYINVYARNAKKIPCDSSLNISVMVTKTGSIPKLAAPKKIVDIDEKVEGCKPISFSWEPVANAQFYVINWSLDGREGGFITELTSAEITLPNVNGHLFVDVFACGSYCDTWVQSNSTQYSTKVEAQPQPNQAPDGSVFCKSLEYRLAKSEIDLIEEYLINGGQFTFFDGLEEINSKIKKTAKIVKIGSVAFQQSKKIELIIEIEKGENIVENIDNLYAFLDEYKSFNKLLKNVDYVCKGIKYSKIVYDIGVYWSITHDWGGSIVWVLCETGKEVGKHFLGVKAGLAFGCKIGLAGGVIGTAAGCIIGGVGGLMIEIYIDKYDCKKNIFTYKEIGNTGSGSGFR